MSKKRIIHKRAPFRITGKASVISLIGLIILTIVLIGVSKLVQANQDQQALSDFYEVIQNNLDDPNVGLAAYMKEAKQLSSGETLQPEFCKDVQLTVKFVATSNAPEGVFLFIPRPAVGIQNGVPFMHTTMNVHTQAWNTLQAEGKKGRVLHELWHISQFCSMAEDRFTKGADATNVTYNFDKLYEDERFNSEAEATAMEAYFYQQDSAYVDPVYNTDVSEGHGYKVMDIWRYYFSTTEVRPIIRKDPSFVMPPLSELRTGQIFLNETNGLPLDIRHHPNYPGWLAFVTEWYTAAQHD